MKDVGEQRKEFLGRSVTENLWSLITYDLRGTKIEKGGCTLLRNAPNGCDTNLLMVIFRMNGQDN